MKIKQPDNDKYVYWNSRPTDTQFFYYQTGTEIVFSIRGTQQLPDFLYDARVHDVRFKEAAGSVHDGFYDCFHSIKPIVDDFLSKNLEKKNVFVTGHSLGGAIATLLAAYIRQRWTDKVMLYTFGCPRVGDTEFVSYFSRTKPFIYFRFVHANDLVTMIPLPGQDFHWYLLPLTAAGMCLVPLSFFDFDGKPYSHFGTLVYLKRHSPAVVEVDVNYKDTPCAQIPIKGMSHGKKSKDEARSLFKGSVKDHNMEIYLSILTQRMHDAIREYQYAENCSQRNSAKIQLTLEEEIQQLEQRKQEVEDSLFTYIEPMPSDHTAVAGVKHPTDNKKEELTKLREAIETRKHDLKRQQALAIESKNPGFRSQLLKQIIDMPWNDNIKNEFKFQVKKV